MRINNLMAVLSVAQTALVLVLLVKVINLEKRPVEPTTVQEQPALPVPSPTVDLETGQPPENPQPLIEGRLRQIVREELRAQLDDLLSPLQAQDDAAAPVSPEEYQYRLDAAMETLDYYLKRGEISNAEMADFQSEIALLDKGGRTQMLSLLARAMSTGELKGQF